MRPLLHNLPVPYLAELPPDLLEPAIRALPLTVLCGPDHRRLQRLWHEETVPTQTYRALCHVTERDTFAAAHSVRASLAANGPLLLNYAAVGPPGVVEFWAALRTARRRFPWALGLPLLYEAYVARLGGGGGEHDGRTAGLLWKAWAEKSPATEPRYITLTEPSSPPPAPNLTSPPFEQAQIARLCTVFVDAILCLAVRVKDVALRAKHTGPRHVLYLNDRRPGQHRVVCALVDHAGATDAEYLVSSPLWREWLEPRLREQLDEAGLPVGPPARYAEFASKSPIQIRVFQPARYSQLATYPERLPLEWDQVPLSPAGASLAEPWMRDMYRLVQVLGGVSSDVSRVTVPDCARFVHRALPYLLDHLARRPNAEREWRLQFLHSLVHVTWIGYPPPADQADPLACARAYTPPAPEDQSPEPAWTLFYTPPL